MPDRPTKGPWPDSLQNLAYALGLSMNECQTMSTSGGSHWSAGRSMFGSGASGRRTEGRQGGFDGRLMGGGEPPGETDDCELDKRVPCLAGIEGLGSRPGLDPAAQTDEAFEQLEVDGAVECRWQRCGPRRRCIIRGRSLDGAVDCQTGHVCWVCDCDDTGLV